MKSWKEGHLMFEAIQINDRKRKVNPRDERTLWYELIIWRNQETEKRKNGWDS